MQYSIGGAASLSSLTERRSPSRGFSGRTRSLTVNPRCVREETADVVIIGSGPVGSTFAAKLVRDGRDVLMYDAGAFHSRRPGWHQKNSYYFQRDVNPFASLIRSALHTLSIPTDTRGNPTLDPLSADPIPGKNQGYVRGNMNPHQSQYTNMPAAASTYAVGGMATHWTAHCPRPHKQLERNEYFPSDALYDEATALLRVSQDAFKHSVRGQLLKKVLNEDAGLAADFMSLACVRNEKNDLLVEWSGADTVLGDLADVMEGKKTKPDDYGTFAIKDNHVCTRFVVDSGSSTTAKVKYAVVLDTATKEEVHVYADTFVLAAGTVLTPQILYASRLNHDLPALGRHLTDHPMAFCQVVWREDRLKELYELNRDAYSRDGSGIPSDPIPIDVHDPDPQCWIPLSEGRPWHCQVHRDAFSYGDLPPNVDPRLIVDFRWFGQMEQRWENRVTFSREVTDLFGLPQPTFDFRYDEKTKHTVHDMMAEMTMAASTVGGYMPGSEPQFMAPGLALHIHGTCRMGNDPDDSVCNANGQVHGVENLYLGGNSVIPKAMACNPTLTSVAFALRSLAHLLGNSLAKTPSFSADTNGALPLGKRIVQEHHKLISKVMA